MGTIGNFIEREGSLAFIALAIAAEGQATISITIDGDCDRVWSMGDTARSEGLQLHDSDNSLSDLSVNAKQIMTALSAPKDGDSHLSIRLFVQGQSGVLKGNVQAGPGVTVQATTSKGTSNLNGRFEIEV